MFDLPDAKRIRRSDLYTRSQSPSPAPSEPDPEVKAQLQARLASIFGSTFDFSTPKSNFQPLATPNGDPQPDSEDAQDENEPPEFEFRLFSTGNNDKVEPQKIVLEAEEEAIGEGGFVVRNRNPKYFFAEKAVGEEKWCFETAALSGEEILDLSKRRAWGLEVPWRVKVLKVVGKSKSTGDSASKIEALEIGDEAKRKRPGKKRRVILRQREKTRAEKEEKRRKEQELKVETEREKRTRRNREKKVKKKLKEKAKKADGVGTEVTNDTIASAGDDSRGDGVE